MSIGPLRMTLGILIIVVGVSGFVFYLVTSLMKIFSGMERVEVPGTRELTLEPGDYSIYWETDSRFNRAPSRSELDVAVVSKGAGVGLPVSGSGLMTSRYSTFDRVGVSIAGFAVDRKDQYTVTVGPAAGKTLPKGGITVSRSMGFLGVLKLVLVCVVILGASLGTGVTLLVRKAS